MYRTDCVTAPPVLPNRLSKVNTSCGLALQIFIYQWELKAASFSIYLCLTLELLWPPRMPPWTACVHFPDSYPIDVSHLSCNFLCLLLLQCIYLNGLIFLQSAGSATTTAGWASTPVQPSHSGAGARLATVYSGTLHTALFLSWQFCPKSRLLKVQAIKTKV